MRSGFGPARVRIPGPPKGGHYVPGPAKVGHYLLVFLIAFGVAVTSAADNWPQFRGPQAGLVADDPALPETWSQTENVVWTADVPGAGWGSPVVWGDHVFVTAAVTATDAEKPKPGSTSARSSPSRRASIGGSSTTSSSRRASCAGSAR